jgi:hypothetical protein
MLMEPKGRGRIKPLPKFLRIHLLGIRVVGGKSKGWAMGKPTSNSGKEQELLKGRPTPPIP